MMISKTVSGTSVESTIKSYSKSKYGRAAFLALISNHAGDTKYQAIVKSISNLLHNIKWNERNYPLDQHVSNNRPAIDDLRDCTTHIMTHKLIWKISVPTLMSWEVIMKELQATLLKFTRTGYLQNLTKKKSVKVSVVTFSGRGKTKWTFVVTLDRNLEIVPLSRSMNWNPCKCQMKAKPPSRNSGLLTVRSRKVTWKMLRNGTGKINLRK